MKSAGNHCAPVVGVLAEVERRERDDPGVEPRVADVLDPLDRRAAARTGDPDRVDVRPVRGVALERLPALDRALVELLAAADDLDRAARRAVVDRQRQAPVALLADHPVVHVAQPVELALVAEVRDPADLVDDVHDLVAQAGVDLLGGQRLARLVVQRTHADEPLVDEAEDERRPAAPAVRVAVGDGLEPVEPVLALEVLDDRLGDIAHVAPDQRPEPVEEDARPRRAARRPAARAPCRAGSPRRRSPGRCGRSRSPRPRRPRSTARPGARTACPGRRPCRRRRRARTAGRSSNGPA